MIDKPEYTTDIPTTTLPLDTNSTKSRGAGFALFIAFIALFFTAIGIAAGYKHWQRLYEKVKVNAEHVKLLDSELKAKTDNTSLNQVRDELNNSIEQVQAQMQASLAQMTALNQQTKQFAETVTEQVEQITHLQARLQYYTAPITAQDWQLEEVVFLLQTANRELHLGGQKQAALTALREADERLSRLGSVTYLPVRQQIAREIGALDAYQEPNIANISQQITQLMLALPPIPIAAGTASAEPFIPAKPATIPATTTSSNAPTDQSVWQSYRQRAQQLFDEAVIVRRLDQPITTTLDNETRQSIYQLLQLRLENLRFLALGHQTQAYHEQAELIINMLKTYYPADQAAPWITQLNELATINLTPTPPDISASLVQLEKARNIQPGQQE